MLRVQNLRFNFESINKPSLDKKHVNLAHTKLKMFKVIPFHERTSIQGYPQRKKFRFRSPSGSQLWLDLFKSQSAYHGRHIYFHIQLLSFL